MEWLSVVIRCRRDGFCDCKPNWVMIHHFIQNFKKEFFNMLLNHLKLSLNTIQHEEIQIKSLLHKEKVIHELYAVRLLCSLGIYYMIDSWFIWCDDHILIGVLLSDKMKTSQCWTSVVVYYGIYFKSICRNELLLLFYVYCY